jgi:AraC-like DNA-binding protein
MFLGRLPNIKEHSHHALQIEIGLQKEFSVFSEQDSLSCRLAIIQPNVPHRIDDNGNLQAIIYLEPESSIGMRLKEKYCQNAKIHGLQFKLVMPYIDKLKNFVKDICPCREARLLFDDILHSLAGEYSSNKVMDKRIKKVISICALTDKKQISTRFLSKKVNLSESRLTHLFKEQVGIPIRRYLLWQKLSTALLKLSKGGSFTDAAHYAGFSDSAHMSRTYRRMYGNSLYDLARNSQFIQAIPCFE